MTFDDFARALVAGRDERRHRDGAATAELAICETVDSTHRLARAVAEGYLGEDELPPAVDVVAWEQRAGRGRGGRAWASPAGEGVYASLLRGVERERLQSLPVAVGVALAEALAPWLGTAAALAWPNDLVVGERKLGGILIDVMSRGEAPPTAVISFGVDVGDAARFAAEVSDAEVTSLTAEHGGEVSLVAVTEMLLAAVDDALAVPAADGELAARYRRLSVHRPGDALRCRTPEETFEGRFLGFDPRGLLRLEVGGEERRIAAGEVMGLD